jgi:hypothetical protein
MIEMRNAEFSSENLKEITSNTYAKEKYGNILKK